MMGLVACVLGNFAFAMFLWEQESDSGKSNDTMATMYICLGLLALYGVWCQFEMYREEGCGLDEDSDDEEEDEPLPPRPAAIQKQIGDGTDAVKQRK